MPITLNEPYLETDVETDLVEELAGVYCYIGAEGTVQHPTQEGTAMLFRSIKGFPDCEVITGILTSRKRVAYLLGTEPERLGFLFRDAIGKPVQPVIVASDNAL